MISMEWNKLRSSDSFLMMNNLTDSYESVNRANNRGLYPVDGVIKLCLFSLICTVQVLHLNSNKSFVLNFVMLFFWAVDYWGKDCVFVLFPSVSISTTTWSQCFMMLDSSSDVDFLLRLSLGLQPLRSGLCSVTFFNLFTIIIFSELPRVNCRLNFIPFLFFPPKSSPASISELKNIWIVKYYIHCSTSPVVVTTF